MSKGILSKKFKIAASGISVQAGPIRVRFEAAGSRLEREELARAISVLPELVALVRETKRILDVEGGHILCCAGELNAKPFSALLDKIGTKR